MNKTQLLAAELYGYSYANYDDHLGIGNVRFERLMPDGVRTLAQAEREGWDIPAIARALEVDEAQATDLLEGYWRAVDIVEAPDAAESFRRGVRHSIRDALARGLDTEAAIESLVTQICYRGADLAFLLDREGRSLSAYSADLRREPATGAAADGAGSPRA